MAMQDNIQVGDIFGRLKIISPPYPKQTKNCKRWYVTCQCQCENKTIKDIRVDSLVNGYIKSCGCIQKENAAYQSLSRKKCNQYDLSGTYGIGYALNYNKQNENSFFFDLEDYDKIKEYYWHFDKDGYLICNKQLKEIQHSIRMHRLIMNCPKDLQIDHINLKKNDNRKENLRICTYKENCRNRNSGRNTSGTIGVSYISKINKWCASIFVNEKQIRLGYFKSKEEAINARLKADKKYFGDFSYNLNKFK